MGRRLFVATICGIFFSVVMAPLPIKGQVRTTPIGELADSLRLYPKPALILLSTDWCKFCQMQKAQLRKNRDFAKLLDSYYYVEFDAESTEDIQFNGQTYHHRNTGIKTGTHDLAVALGQTDKGLSYPTWVLMDAEFNIVFRYGGTLRPKELFAIMTAYLAENNM